MASERTKALGGHGGQFRLSSARTSSSKKDEDRPPRGERGRRGKQREAERRVSRGGESALVIPKGSEVRENGSWPSDDYVWQVGMLGDDEEGESDAPFMDAVVKVYCTHTEPNFSLPWQKRRQYSSTGSGFMIAGRRLLTNAHCIEHHTQVKVKRRGDDTKFVANVLAVGTECDIALLAVEDEAFWAGPKALDFGGLPHLQDAVTVVGYPIGGDTISVTRGVVSRIEVTSYVHGSSELLGVQIDAAINAGNSGGPAFNDDGECVGIAFQSLKSPDAENIGYVIPTPVIYHFLNDYERNGRYTGFPALGITWQRMESVALRACFKMGSIHKGVLIRRVEPTSEAHSLVKEGDVLMEFDGIPVANDGTVAFRSGERISFGFLVSQKFAGESAKLVILRNGEALTLEVKLNAAVRLIPVHIGGRLPSYFIMAGLVFTPVVQPFLESEYGSDYEFDSPVRILDKLLHGQAEYGDQQVVVLAQVLAHDVNIGYEDTTNTQVLRVNGVQIRNLRHLALLVDSCTEPYLRFDLEHSEIVVVDGLAAKAATPEILKDHCIPSDRSLDLQLQQDLQTPHTPLLLLEPETETETKTETETVTVTETVTGTETDLGDVTANGAPSTTTTTTAQP